MPSFFSFRPSGALAASSLTEPGVSLSSSEPAESSSSDLSLSDAGVPNGFALPEDLVRDAKEAPEPPKAEPKAPPVEGVAEAPNAGLEPPKTLVLPRPPNGEAELVLPKRDLGAAEESVPNGEAVELDMAPNLEEAKRLGAPEELPKTFVAPAVAKGEAVEVFAKPLLAGICWC